MQEISLDVMNRKKSPEVFLDAFKKALSYFPELNDTYIFIHETPFYGVQHTLRTYLPLVVLHWRKSNMVYPIVINKRSSMNASFHDLLLNEQIGILAHELSHISEYIKLSRRGMVQFVVRYGLYKKWVKKMEEETDMLVIKRGAGTYLLDYRIRIMEFRIQNPYRETEDTYMLPHEIIDKMKEFPQLYPSELIEIYKRTLQEIEQNSQKSIRKPDISFIRRIKHGIKSVYAFVPAFIEMFYLIPIKKVHK